MQFAKGLFAITIFLISTIAFSADHPVYNANNGMLTIPFIDVLDQVGQFQDAAVQFTPQGTWQLVGYQTLGTPKLQRVQLSSVEVIKTTTFPVSVYLRATGSTSDCGYSGQARIQQRLVDARFDVGISVPFTDGHANGLISCIGVVRSFKMTVPLEVYGVKAGTYTYSVNGITGTFNLASDNKFSDECDVTGCR